MKLIAAFFKLIRWPNLFFIALTQCLFYFCVFETMLNQPGYDHKHFLFYLLIVASVTIAAAGYIINDYFDLQIDAVNKPSKVVVDKIVKRRWAIIWHWFLSGIGILLSIYISYRIGNWLIAVANVAARNLVNNSHAWLVVLSRALNESIWFINLATLKQSIH